MATRYEQMMATFEFLRRRRTNYQQAWGTQPAAQEVLMDLAKFCRANESCIVKDREGRVDVQQTLILEGRREVWQRIQNHINLQPSQLYSIYTGHQFNPEALQDTGESDE